MMSSENIYKGNSCPTAGELSRFKTGEFSLDEKAKLDAHLRDCPFCEDALEGFSLTSADPVLINDKLHALIDKRTGEKSSGWGLKLAAAAVILAILSGGYYLLDPGLKKESNELSAEKSVPLIPELSEEDAVSLTGESDTSKLKRMVLADNTVQKADTKNDMVISEHEISAEKNIQDDRGAAFKQGLELAEPGSKPAPAIADLEVAGNAESFKTEENAGAVTVDEIAKETASDKFVESTNVNAPASVKAAETRAFALTKASKDEDNGKKKKAKKNDEPGKSTVTGSVTEEYKDHSVADPLHDAEKLFNLKNYNECLQLLGKDGINKKDERYLWMFAKSCAETGKKTEAITALEELLKLPDTTKRTEAEALLRELRK